MPTRDVGDVHRAALAPVGARRLAVELGHHRADVDPLGDAVAVAAMGGGDPVGRDEARRRRRPRPPPARCRSGPGRPARRARPRVFRRSSNSRIKPIRSYIQSSCFRSRRPGACVTELERIDLAARELAEKCRSSPFRSSISFFSDSVRAGRPPLPMPLLAPGTTAAWSLKAPIKSSPPREACPRPEPRPPPG